MPGIYYFVLVFSNCVMEIMYLAVGRGILEILAHIFALSDY